MYNVSADYKSQIKKTLRNPSYLKVEFSIVDPQAIGDSSISTLVDEVYYSDLQNVENNFEVPKTYMTLEHNRFFLDGVNPLAPEIDAPSFLYQGFVGSEISDADGYWSVNPKITIDFVTTYFEFIGLTFNFDNVRNEFPEQFQIIAYKDGLEVYNEIVFPNTATMFVHEDAIPECNKIELVALKSTTPHRRFRFENLIFGIIKIFDHNTIVDASWKRESDLVNTKLPNNEFTFKVIDLNREYDPENVTGIYQYIESQQPINFKFGYELDNESIEWVQGGNLITTGAVDVSSDAIIPMVEFKTTSTLSFLNDVYDNAVYSATPVTLYDLAVDVLEFANIPLNAQGNNRWILDTSLQSYSTMMPLPKAEVRVLLQLIANAGMCLLDVDRDGNIVIEPKDTTPSDFTFTLSDVTSIPLTSKYPILKGVDTSVSSLSVEATATELASFDISGASSTTYVFEYDMATNVVATAGTGLTIVGAVQYYARKCIVTLTGTGKLTINGKLINVIKENISVEFNSTGERCLIENELITNRTHGIQYATWIGDYVNRRNEYTFDDRGFPELDCGDEVALDTLFNNGVGVTITGVELNYNGTISGKTKVLIR